MTYDWLLYNPGAPDPELQKMVETIMAGDSAKSRVGQQYIVVWVECDDAADAERLEPLVVAAAERVARSRLVQNRIQDEQP